VSAPIQCRDLKNALIIESLIGCIFAMDQSNGMFQIDESGYGRSQTAASVVVTGGKDGLEVEGCVGPGALLPSVPGRAGWNEYTTIRKIMAEMAAINQMPILLLLISPNVILSSLLCRSTLVMNQWNRADP
jgi:hypothetical protein